MVRKECNHDGCAAVRMTMDRNGRDCGTQVIEFQKRIEIGNIYVCDCLQSKTLDVQEIFMCAMNLDGEFVASSRET